MLPLPSSIEPLLLQFSLTFSNPTFVRFQVLLGASILSTGRRTVANLLRTVRDLAPGDTSSYRRVLSQRKWSMWVLGHVLASYIVEQWVPVGVIRINGDDSVSEHKGARVFGKGRHRDAVRSTNSFMAYRWGHKWVVLCILVQFPFAYRPWALPVLVALYRTPAWNREHGRRHKTPVKLMRQMLIVFMRWFPGRNFRFSGDDGFSPHELAELASRSGGRLVLVGKFHPEAALYKPPPKWSPPKKAGRPRKKGDKLPSPQDVVARQKHRKKLNVSWYGGKRRNVAVVSGTGGWYRAGRSLVPVRWVHVEDLDGTHREEYFFCTDPTFGPQQIIEAFTERWSIEVTFEEARAYLGLETTRGWCEKTVLRMEPCLLGSFSVVALWYAALSKRDQQAGRIEWDGKDTVTFSDAISSVRRYLWTHWVFERYHDTLPLEKVPRAFREMLLYALAPAA